jgi:hypothetical protein
LKIDKEILDRINKINWFENCGKSLKIELSIDIVYINSWEEAKEHYHDENWESATLEARNELTSFLQKNYRSQYVLWNKLVKEAKEFLDKQVVPKIELQREKNDLDQLFLECVKWDILNAIMEHTYLKSSDGPVFFLELLKVYESGNFPCGWKGKWPKGTLLVY